MQLCVTTSYVLMYISDQIAHRQTHDRPNDQPPIPHSQFIRMHYTITIDVKTFNIQF